MFGGVGRPLSFQRCETPPQGTVAANQPAAAIGRQDLDENFHAFRSEVSRR